MEWAKRQATKVQDYHKYHLSGDVPVEGTGAATVRRLESPTKDPRYQDIGYHDHDPVGIHVNLAACNKYLSERTNISGERSSLDLQVRPLSADTEHTNLSGERSNRDLQARSLSADTERSTHNLNPNNPSSNQYTTLCANQGSDTLHTETITNNQSSYSTSPTQSSAMSEREQALLKKLEEQKAASSKLQQELAELKIQAEIELERQKQEQWTVAIGKIRKVQDKAKQQHATQLDNIQDLILKVSPQEGDLLSKLKSVISQPTSEEERLRQEQEEKEKKQNREMLEQLVKQQQQI